MIAARGRDAGDGRVRDPLEHPAGSHRERLAGQALGVVPVPGAEPAGRRLAQQHRAVAAAEPQRRCGLVAVEREPRGLVDPAGLVDTVAQVHVGATGVVGDPQVERDRERLAQAGLGRLVLAETGAGCAERVEGLPRFRARADRAGDGERLLAARDRITAKPAQHEQLPLGRDDPRPLGARRIGRQRGDRLAVGRCRLVLAAHDPEVAAQALVHQPGADRVAAGVDPGSRVTAQGDRALAIRAEVRRLGGAARQIDPIHPGAALRAVDVVPDVEGISKWRWASGYAAIRAAARPAATDAASASPTYG